MRVHLRVHPCGSWVREVLRFKQYIHCSDLTYVKFIVWLAWSDQVAAPHNGKLEGDLAGRYSHRSFAQGDQDAATSRSEASRAYRGGVPPVAMVLEQNLEGKTHRHLNWLVYEFIRDGGQVNRKPERRQFDEDYFFDLVISVDGHPVYVEFVITDDDPDDPDDYPNIRIVSVHPADP